MKPALYVIGAVIELFGIVLIAAPDIIPGATRVARGARARWRPIENQMRRLLRLPTRTIFGEARLVVGQATVAGISAIVGTSETTLDQKVEFLLRRDHESQEAINAIQRRLDELERASGRGLDDLRTELKGHVSTALTEAQADFRVARICGVVLLLVGLGAGTWGNLLK